MNHAATRREARIVFFDAVTGKGDLRQMVKTITSLGIGLGMSDDDDYGLTNYVATDVKTTGALDKMHNDAIDLAVDAVFEQGFMGGPAFNRLVDDLIDIGVSYGRTCRNNVKGIELSKGEYSEQHMTFVRRLIVDHLGTEPDRIEPDSHIIDDLGADSLDIVELIMVVEEEYGIEIPDDEAEKIGTVRDIAVYLTEKQVPERKRRRPKD